MGDQVDYSAAAPQGMKNAVQIGVCKTDPSDPNFYILRIPKKNLKDGSPTTIIPNSGKVFMVPSGLRFSGQDLGFGGQDLNAAAPITPVKVPFYKNKKVLMIGGGVIVVGIVAYFLMKKK